MNKLTLKLICVALVLSASQLAIAANDKKTASPLLSSHSSFYNNLKTFTGKNVTLVLNNGQQITGEVKDLSKGLVHIEMVGQKSFYDAVVKINEITAIEAKVRK